jgi:hypothetical protein
MRIDWELLDEAARGDVAVGDLVSVEAGGAPTWRVLKLADGRAWLRDDARQMDCISGTDQFHWRASIRGA